MIFAPDVRLVPTALAECARVMRGLWRHPHERHPAFPYELLWEERSCARWQTSPARMRAASSKVVPRAGIVTRTRMFPLVQANAAIAAHRSGALQGAAVLVP